MGLSLPGVGVGRPCVVADCVIDERVSKLHKSFDEPWIAFLLQNHLSLLYFTYTVVIYIKIIGVARKQETYHQIIFREVLQ